MELCRQTDKTCWIWGTHILTWSKKSMRFGLLIPKFQRNVLPPISQSVQVQTKKQNEFCLLVADCLVGLLFGPKHQARMSPLLEYSVLHLTREKGSPCNKWGFNGGDYEACRLLGCYAVWLLFSQEAHGLTSQKTASFCAHHIKMLLYMLFFWMIYMQLLKILTPYCVYKILADDTYCDLLHYVFKY
jgi:hypothetical protein